MARDRIVGPGSAGVEEEQYNYALRPLKFSQYIGQESLIRKLKIAVQAATPRARVEAANRFLNMRVPKTNTHLRNILHLCSSLGTARGLPQYFATISPDEQRR